MISTTIDDWVATNLGDVVDIRTGKLDSNYAEEKGEYPFFTCAPDPLRINDFAFDCEAILLAGNNADGIFHLNFYSGKFNAYQRTYVITVKDKNKLDLRYLYYYLHLSLNLLKDFSQGTSTKFLTMRILNDLEISLPPLEEQKKISKTLSDLDDKIKTNMQMSQTLEKIGQAVFKRWFVDFEFPNEEGKPYKSSGGEMVYNELLGKNIPIGWTVRELGDFIEFVKGKKPAMVSASQDEGFLPHILINALEGNEQIFAHTKDMVIVKETDVLMVMDGASSGRVERGQKGVLGSTLAQIEAQGLTTAYVYHFLKNKEVDINQNTTGTSIPHADKARVKKYHIVIPDNDRVSNQFEILSNCILFKFINNKSEIQTLQRIRDHLLPKLMSGKIRVPVQEENVETP